MWKARDLLATPSHEPLTIIVDQLFTPQQSIEHQTARALYDFCVANFSNCLTLMLLKVYRFSSVNVTRLRSILLLSETLTKNGVELSPVSLNHIKQFLVSCLKMRNATKRDNVIVKIIVSCVASMFDNGGWDELGVCILSLLYTDPLKAFSVFVDLPPIHGDFINIVHRKLQEEVYKVLLHPDDDWTLGLETAIKLGLQVSDTEQRSEILETVVKSAEKLVSMGMEKSLEEALQRLLKFLAKDAILCKWSTNQCGYVAEFAFTIAGIGAQTKETAKKISQMVAKLDPNPCFNLSPSRLDYGLGQDRHLYFNLLTLSAVEVLSTFAKAKHDDRSRETAMRRLHDLLCDHTSGKWDLDVSEIEKLQPMLISCLKEEVMPENTFEILGKVIYHVAMETFSFTDDPWFDLWDYIASESEFDKAVYIFQCLTMRLDDKEGFVVPAVSKFLPEISSRLNPPRAVLVDNSRWVLAFTGGFCTVIRMVNQASHAGFVKEIALKMIDSVKVLVQRRMEVGLVRRACRILERIVEEQWDWYEAREYRLVKDLLRRLYEIKGMKMESKMVLWRISGTLERNVNEELRVLSGLGCLNGSE
ncbi:hypothetical protein N665_0100s0004 [Sinapis alba]|nr:hypothetical protein N665_0100s0004 [Sinapis alba]